MKQLVTLQKLDGIVKSIQDIRPVYANWTDERFALWYASRYQVKEKRVLAILKILKEG